MKRSATGGASRRGLQAAAAVCAATAGLAAWAVWPRTAAPAAAGLAVPVRTAHVVRADVAARQIVPGTLGYRGSYSVTNELPAGIVTWTASPGAVVRRGHVLYRVANQPAVLMIGHLPAWRPFQPGMAPGPDVAELDANLVALGFDPGHAITIDEQFTWATAAAVERWQHKRGMAETGTIALGQITFVPYPARVAQATAARGETVTPAAPVLQVTSTRPTVSAAMPVGQATVRPGDHVIVTLPDGTTTVAGTVAAVGRVATAASAGSPGPATIAVTIRLAARAALSGLDQAPVQVTVTEQQDRGVLAVPVTALLARPGGGYAVQLGPPARRLVAVTTGLFDDATGLVEVSGRGLTAGLPVEVAAG
jgi:peptidoglycan hydrolase-like protein with peptidoglycan-binding domain